MERRRFDESDLIRLKLQQLDRETTSRPLLTRLFSSAPALPFAIAFIIGIIAASHMGSLNHIWVIFYLTVPTAIGLTFFTHKIRRKKPLLPVLLLSCLIIFVLGTIRYYLLLDRPPNHISRYIINDRELATMKGQAISPIRTDPLQTGISSIPWISCKSSFYVETRSLKTANGWQDACGKVRVQVSEPADHLSPGDLVLIHCWLSRFSPPANPGQYNLSNHMHQRGVHVAATVGVKEGILILEHGNSLLSKFRNNLYRYASGVLLDETLTDNEVRSLVSALLLGRRTDLSPRIMSAFQDTNLAHFISLSGMHIGILSGSLWVVLRTCGLSRRPRAILCIVFILLYAMLVPPRAATLRAVFLSCFFFASVLSRRQTSPLNTLAVSAMVLLLARPWELFSAGWQLSFMSVLGILLLYPSVRFHLLIRLFYPAAPYLNRFSLFRDLLRSTIELLAVGLSAWFTIAPVLLFYFGRVNPLSPLWTILVFPFVLVILYAGFLKILIAAIFPTISVFLGWILHLAATWLENAVIILSKVDLFQITSCRPGLYLVLAIYAMMLSLTILPYRYQTARKILTVLVVGCFLWPAVSRSIQNRFQDSLELTCLSVGHGQAVVLSSPDNQHFLFDAGSITNKDISRKVIQPFLQHRSIFSLEAIYLSHGDMDHINAVTDLGASVKIKTVYANRTLLQSAKNPSIEKQLVKNLSQAGIRVIPFDSPADTADFSIKSIWPTRDILNKESVSENDASEVILIEYANKVIMLCGDIERYAQNQLMELYPENKVDVMVLPHHGSTTNLDKRFIKHFNPSIAIASCSRRSLRNAYQPADKDIVETLYTARDGAITVKIKADGTISVDGFLSQ